jgi:hypothetical protein
MVANPNTTFAVGFEQIGTASGCDAGEVKYRKVAAAYSTQICRGDYVVANSTGYIGIANTGSYGNTAVGIFMGATYISTAQNKPIYSQIWPTGDHAYDGNAAIIPIDGTSPSLFKVMSLNVPITLADIGATIDINVGTQSVLGSSGVSGMTVDPGTLNTGNWAFKVVAPYSTYVGNSMPGCNDSANNNMVVVRANPFNESGV